MRDKRYFRLIDFLVLVFFISTAILGLLLFRIDLMRTLDMRDSEPVGTIVIRNNVVQRRHDDRVLWDRIYVSSPVYPGDLIRAADLSSATIDIEGNEISLNENTLIRIGRSYDGRSAFQIELREGNLSITSNQESLSIMLELMGRQVQVEAGAVVNAEASDEGISVQVSEGTATYITEGQIRQIAEGAMIAMDSSGVEKTIPAAVVLRPQPNARYLKNRAQPLAVDFTWSKVNIESGEKVRLEIASDRGFTQNHFIIENLDTSAQIAFDTGTWHWKFIYEDVTLRSGQLSIVDATGPALYSPVEETLFRFHGSLPQIRFQWTERKEASHYIIEINDTVDFTNPRMRRQVSSASFIQSELGEGPWFWRVRPVFMAIYEGASSYSSVGSFRIEKAFDMSAPVIEIPLIPVERTMDAETAAAEKAAQEAAQQAVAQQSVIAAAQQSAAQRTAAQSGQQTTAPIVGSIPTAAEAVIVSRQPRPRTRDPERFHTVIPGETLARIARIWYGNGSLYMLIVEENEISNPDLIYIDQVLYIP